MKNSLSIGDHAPLFALTSSDESKKSWILRDQAGKFRLLLFYGKDEIADCQEIAFAFRDSLQTFNDLKTEIVSISLNLASERKKFAAKHNIPFVLLSDPRAEVAENYNVYDRQKRVYNRAAILLDKNLRILGAYKILNAKKTLDSIIQHLKSIVSPEEPRHIQNQAPVLIVPDVLPLEFCQDLIEVWKTEGNQDSGFMLRDGDKTIEVLDPKFKIRRDHFVKNHDLRSKIDFFIKSRLAPEIKKAYCFEASHREDYKIARYDAESQGFFKAHRDNTTGGTAHRRFAMTLNLNAGEYEGGYLRFPEYSDNIYRPQTGSAVVFSCSLLHEATSVIQGHRFALLTFFYGEKESISRKEYEEKYATEGYRKILALEA